MHDNKEENGDVEHRADRFVKLRDYFAAQAMNAIIIGNNADISVTDGSLGSALDAYCVADAMMKARDMEAN